MVSVLIPWRGGCEHREAALAWVLQQFPSSWEVVLGECPTEEWCKALAVKDALSRASGDELVVHDADVWCDSLRDAVNSLELFRWAVPHRSTRRLTQEATEHVLAGASPEQFTMSLVEPIAQVHVGGGIVVLKREVYERVPLDPRFQGWGHEDDAWGMALRTLTGEPYSPRGRLWHLWHPPQWREDRWKGGRESYDLYRRYDAAFGKRAEMRALLDEVTA